MSAFVVGLLTGVLSGCGIGGGSLLLLWLTLVQDMPQFTAGGINLLYFLACAPAALVSHLKNHLIDRGAVKFCVPFGAMTSLLASFAAAGTDTSLLRRLFGVLLLYIGGVILPSVLELAGGWALYKLYHTRWWDYSDFPFNIGGYICLEFSLLWGVGTVVVMKAVHPVIAGLVEMVPQMVGFVLMCILYACYAADVVVTAFAASDLARELDALEKVADSMHAVSDAMTELLGTTAMDVDQKMDESRLQLKLAAAEARDNAAKLSPRDAAAALRAKADEAMEAARKSSQEARLNASEAATAVKLAAKGTAERTAELLRLEQLAEELQARSEEMRARTRSSKYFGKGRMLRAYPKLRHGEKHRSLDELRERLKYERRH